MYVLSNYLIAFWAESGSSLDTVEQDGFNWIEKGSDNIEIGIFGRNPIITIEVTIACACWGTLYNKHR